MKREILEVVVKNRLRSGKYCIVSIIESNTLVLATPDMETADWTKAMKAIADHLGITAEQFTERALTAKILRGKEQLEESHQPGDHQAPNPPPEEVTTVARNNKSDMSGNSMQGDCEPRKACTSKGKPTAKAKSSPKPTTKSPVKQK